jgi:hypothetical protein
MILFQFLSKTNSVTFYNVFAETCSLFQIYALKKVRLKKCLEKRFRGTPWGIYFLWITFTVNAIEVLIKYCTNCFLKLINSFDRKLINFLLLLDEPIRFRFRTNWPIGNAQEVKRNLNSYKLINLRKLIDAIFYQHFYCIDSKDYLIVYVDCLVY